MWLAGGKLPLTWYPKDFVKVPMTDMRSNAASTIKKLSRTNLQILHRQKGLSIWVWPELLKIFVQYRFCYRKPTLFESIISKARAVKLKFSSVHTSFRIGDSYVRKLNSLPPLKFKITGKWLASILFYYSLNRPSTVMECR